jgi:hypothetical protein
MGRSGAGTALRLFRSSHDPSSARAGPNVALCPGVCSGLYLTPATTMTTTGSVTAASSVPSATAPDTGFTSR